MGGVHVLDISVQSHSQDLGRRRCDHLLHDHFLLHFDGLNDLFLDDHFLLHLDGDRNLFLDDYFLSDHLRGGRGTGYQQ